MKSIRINDAITIANDKPFVLLAGPCQIESLAHALDTCQAIKEVCDALAIPLIYKSSFDKANRSSMATARGVGMEQGLDILNQVKQTHQVPIVTDVHEPWQCETVAEVADVLQIPAFLCRQTDLLVAAARTGRVINVKKGQFLAPWDMQHVADKIASSGNDNILLCERGTSFGYNTLVSDFRGLATMAGTGYPVVFDATHSVQQPGGQGSTSGGQREFVPLLARAAAAVGMAALFIETHENPDEAPSDGPNMLPLAQLPEFLSQIKAYDSLTKQGMGESQD